MIILLFLLLLIVGCQSHPVHSSPAPASDYVHKVGAKATLLGRLRVYQREVILQTSEGKNYWLDINPTVVKSFDGSNVKVDGFVWKEFVKTEFVGKI